jgi:hypothetical protein
MIDAGALALSGAAGRVNSFERSNGLADAVSFLF